MSTEVIIVTIFSVLFAIIGFLIVDKLSTIDKSLSKLSDKLDDQSDTISDHNARISALEAVNPHAHVHA